MQPHGAGTKKKKIPGIFWEKEQRLLRIFLLLLNFAFPTTVLKKCKKRRTPSHVFIFFSGCLLSGFPSITWATMELARKRRKSQFLLPLFYWLTDHNNEQGSPLSFYCQFSFPFGVRKVKPTARIFVVFCWSFLVVVLIHLAAIMRSAGWNNERK